MKRKVSNLVNDFASIFLILLFRSHAVLQMVIERTMKDDAELEKKENETSGNKFSNT